MKRWDLVDAMYFWAYSAAVGGWCTMDWTVTNKLWLIPVAGCLIWFGYSLITRNAEMHDRLIEMRRTRAAAPIVKLGAEQTDADIVGKYLWATLEVNTLDEGLEKIAKWKLRDEMDRLSRPQQGRSLLS